MPTASRLQTAGKTETYIVEARVRATPEARAVAHVCRTTVAGAAVQATDSGCPNRSASWRADIATSDIATIVVIRGPLPDIAQHVVKPEAATSRRTYHVAEQVLQADAGLRIYAALSSDATARTFVELVAALSGRWAAERVTIRSAVSAAPAASNGRIFLSARQA